MENDILVVCPHCELFFQVSSLNCAIFRHAVYNNSYIQVDPHASKETCDKLILEGSIIGCGKPVRVIREGEEYKTIVCDYI